MTNGILDSSQKIVTSNLLLNYDIAQFRSYPTTGTTITDLSGNINSGTLVNGVSYNSSNGGNLFFDGINDYLSTNLIGSNSSSYTWETWCKPTNFIKEFNTLVRGRDGFGNGWNIQSRIKTTGNFSVAIVNTSPAEIDVTSTASAVLGNWYCITGVLTYNLKLELYVNGIFSGVTANSNTNLRTSTVGWNIGTIASTSFSIGTVSTATIYNRALTSTEILQNFNVNKSRYGL